MPELYSMKLDKEERKEAMPSEAKMERPAYPYGLRIDLDKTALDKLGVGVLPSVGAKIMVHALCEVSSISQSDGEYGDNKHACLQITDMALAPAPSKTDLSKLYGGKE